MLHGLSGESGACEARCVAGLTPTQASFQRAMARAPAVGTLWFLAIVRLDLTACVFSLLLFAAYVWGAGYRLVL